MPAPNPIPIPSRYYWRDKRMTVMPPVTFVLLVVTILWMWRTYVHPPSLVGEVEAIRVNVVSTLAGTVLELRVDPLQHVTNGQPVAVIATTESDAMQAELKAIEADLELTKARLMLDSDRNRQGYDQMQVQLLNDRMQLGIDQTNLSLAESEFNRAEQLFNSKTLISEQMFEMARAKRDALRVTVSARTRLVAEMDGLLASHDPQVLGTNQNKAIAAAIQAEQDRLLALQKPLVLKAPINGFVSSISKRAGERFTAGLPIAVVSASEATRIIGWVRQPVLERPSPGDLMEVRTRRLPGRALQVRVTAVGGQLEPVSAAALPFTPPGNRVEYGLQVLLQLPSGSDLIPGEMVSLALKSKAADRGTAK